MAPARRRGTKGEKGNSRELKLGDLVLAKVKGFPAWPAKISRPEDWDRVPDPKKYFVQFFGTEEIAFVAPADIQAFTNEAKNKVLARCQAKTVKYFAPAVKEICQAFEQLKHKNSGSSSDVIDKSDVDRDALSANGEEDVLEDGLKDGSSTDGISREPEVKSLDNSGPGLECCSQRHKVLDCHDIKSSVSCKEGESFPPVVSPKKKKQNKRANDEVHTLKEVVLALSCPKDEVREDNQEDADDARKDVGKDSLLVKSARSRDLGTGKKVVVNGQKTGKMTTEPNKKFKESHDNNNDDSSTVFARPKGSSTCINGCPDDHSKDSIVRKSATRSGWRDLYEEPKLNVDTSGEKKKELGKHRKTFQIVKGQKDAGDNPEQLARPEFSGLKKGAELGCTEYELGTNEVSYAAKTAKHSDAAAKYASKGMLQGRKHGSGCSIDIGQKAANHTAEDRSASKVQIGKTFSHISSDEDDLPPTKLRCWASEAPSNSANKRVENRVGKFSLAKKNDESHADLVKSTVTQLHKKRRALRMYDDDDEERPKTPVHGRPASRVNLSASLKKTESKVESADDFPITSKDSGAVGSRPSEERSCSVRVVSELSSINSDLPLDKKSKKVIAVPVPPSPVKPLDRVTTKKQISGSPKKSPLIGGASYRQVSELTKADGLLLKVSGVGNQKRTQTGPVKGSSDGVRNAQSLVNSERGKTISSERSRSIEHNSTLEVNNTDYLRGSSAKDSTFSGGRLDSGVDNGMDQFVGSKISQSPMSMRNLIAAAQARRKQAHSQNNIHGDANTLLAPSSDKPMRSASPSSDVQHSLPESSNVLQPDVQRLYSNTSKVSPHHDLSSDNQPGAKEYEETRVGLGLLPSAGLLSGGTDAAVARDAFEGMIETLSRTRESIRRATRLAIDCAKYGIANEVVEVLIRKLESESDNHRKIDLFFLVDSITQCSHTQKGIAGASYIPTVQAALPRLLGAAAAAPPGAAAHENRRQCLKVLRLWLERKILPDSLLQRYIDGMGVSDDDASAGFFLRHPSRTERAVDDPIREMDGMLVDEYGSNATFQLPGFLSSHVFEDDEDDVPGPSYAEPCGESPTEELPAAGDSEACAVTPSDRRHCILEHVDGELEMEDVSGHPKDEQSLCENSSIEFASKQLHSDEFMVADSEELSPLCGSPPLPHNSPPPTPPLPSSSPPSSSPPPPPSSPSAPPPPPFLSLPQSLPVPPSGPRLSLLTQPSLPPAMMSQQVHLPPSIPNVAPNLAYQPPLTLENCSIRSGNKFAQTAASTTLRDHTDASVREEMYAHQSISFMPAGINSSNEASRFSSSRPLDYGNHDLHVNSQASQPNQHFQPGNPPFPQRPFHPVPLPSHSCHYIYQTSPANQLLQNPYSRPYSLPNLPDGTNRYVADEQWRSANEFKTGNSRGAWMSGGGTPSCSAPSGAPYAREGYFSSPFERTNMSKVGFQPTTPNTVLSGAPVPGHAVSPSLPSRPDMPGVNRWRPS